MKIKISKKDLYKAMLKHLIDKEEFELCAKLRDTIEKITEDNTEYYVIDSDEFTKIKNN